MIRTLIALTLAATPTIVMAAGPSASNITMSDQLTVWLRAQGGMEAAKWQVFDRMHDVDQMDGLRPERLQSDMDHMLLDHVSEVTERVMRSDIDDDGGVALEEFVAMNPAEEPEDLQIAFRRYDADGDGLTLRAEVSEAERRMTEQSNAASPLHEMATWDLDGDRVATRVEIQEVLMAQASKLWPAQ